MEVIVGKLSTVTIQPIIMEAIKGGPLVDPLMEKLKQEALKNKQLNFFISVDKVLRY